MHEVIKKKNTMHENVLLSTYPHNEIFWFICILTKFLCDLPHWSYVAHPFHSFS